MAKLRVGIIFGGMSSEREVSLNSGRNVYDNIDRELYEPCAIFMDGQGYLWMLPWQLVSQNTTTDISEHLEREAKRVAYESLKDNIDFAFLALHGKYGDDGCIQGVLELLGIPYTGPGILASALGMDKIIQQKILAAEGIGVPRSDEVTAHEWQRDSESVVKRITGKFAFPFVTKPCREGSSVGVTIVRESGSLGQGIAEALKWDNVVLVEEFLDGVEFSSIILEEGGEAFPLSLTEIYPQSEFYTYDDKYMPGRCRKFTPPKNLPGDVVAHIKKEAVRAFRALGFRCYGRIDGFVLKDGRVLITDPNSSSGMAPSSFFFEQAAEQGMLPVMIISKLVEIALEIHREKKGPL
ncbi:MAG TPA: D-alanine--D-alanine ligase [Syntrophales bacterium]|nr:D-alanine--D-alanine ligase [Syntrophales bacterium]HOX93311.1 D-alanine--D-alanine ligase [Syntrophales bacterium]HPI56512.1 D-alanine--D-alanine ligase [Syntrophales bacterium]HPN25067.1 D-alanine--D-alanine ligase [Syntrophales bacterium]HQM29190.1 D-alanine--D-alanine ligase [Syntrophales bacterium]